MSSQTENFHLVKHDSTDDYEDFRTAYNDNMDIIDEHLGQGGGGSTVSWSQLQVTGDKIATITVSGIPQDVFAPNSQTFTMAVSRANINSGETYPTIFGKIKKWFADLKAVAFSGSYNDLSNTPTKVSDFTNDSGFITSTVNNLANYYLKSETYTQAQVDALIGAISTISIEVVQSLPVHDIKTNTIYLVPKQTAGTQNVYDEYIYVNNAWELIGDTEIDLSNYVTTTDLATTLQDYVTSTGLSTILANYYTSSQIDTLLGGKVNDVEVNGTSVVNAQGVAEITVPDDLADLADDSTHRTVTDTEKSTWSAKVSDNPTFTEASTRANIVSGESFATILGKIKKFFTDLKTVAFSGSYNDLSDKPTIPTVNNATLTIQKNGTNVTTFTANASSNVTANITVPTDIIYTHYASTSNIGSVVVTHPEQASSDGHRKNLYAYGNGNGHPWFMEIIYAYSYVRCISINKTVDVGVRYIDSTHFAIVSNFWDSVTVCGNEDNFSVATSSTSYTIDTSSTRLPMPDRSVYTDSSQTGIKIKRVGKVVTIFISRSDTLSTSGITIPTGYRPPTDLYFIGKAYINDSGYDTWSQGFRIETDGKLTARATNNNSSITVSWISASVTYITEQDYPS